MDWADEAALHLVIVSELRTYNGTARLPRRGGRNHLFREGLVMLSDKAHASFPQCAHRAQGADLGPNIVAYKRARLFSAHAAWSLNAI